MDDTLLEFPCTFPIKIVGMHDPGLREHVEAVAAAQAVTVEDLSERESGRGTYLALTLTVRATSKAQLDALYIALGDSALVRAIL